jgi:HrpA-like RNA helicase
VPQAILDSFITNKMGGYCNVICTQPRRISAIRYFPNSCTFLQISIAERVSQERCEKIGDIVGYQVRLESKVTESYNLW